MLRLYCHMSWSLSSLKEGYSGDYLRGRKGDTGSLDCIAHMLMPFDESVSCTKT